MTTHLSGRRIALGVGLATVALAISACDRADPPAPTAPSVPPAPPPLAVDYSEVSSADFNYYSADGAMSQEGGYPGFEPPDAYRSITYQVERVLQSNGIWASTIHLDQRFPFGTPPGPEYDIDVARIETDDAHSYYRVYDRTGALVQANYSEPVPVMHGNEPPYVPPNAEPLPEWPNTDPPPPPPDEPPPSECDDPTQIECEEPMMASLASAGADANPAAGDLSWIDNIIVTPLTRVRIQRHLEARFGRSTEQVRGLDRYTRVLGSTFIEVLVDPVSGAIVEENVAENGELRAQTVHQYITETPGVYVKTGTRTELAPLTPGGERVAITSTLSNVRVGKVLGGVQ